MSKYLLDKHGPACVDKHVKFHCVASAGEVDRAVKLFDKTGIVMIFDNMA